MFPLEVEDETALAFAEGYAMAVEDFSCNVLEETVKDFIKGDVPEHNRKFLPTCAELAYHARKVSKKYQVPLGYLDFTDPEIINDPEVIRRENEAHKFAMERF